jgi:hypothetical protein
MRHALTFAAALAVIAGAAGSPTANAAPRLGSDLIGSAVILADGERPEHQAQHQRHDHRQQGYVYFYQYNPHYRYSPHYSYSPHEEEFFWRVPQPGFVYQYCSSGVCFGW